MKHLAAASAVGVSRGGRPAAIAVDGFQGSVWRSRGKHPSRVRWQGVEEAVKHEAMASAVGSVGRAAGGG